MSVSDDEKHDSEKDVPHVELDSTTDEDDNDLFNDRLVHTPPKHDNNHEEEPMFAMPPTKAQLDLENQVEVGNSPAFHCLNELFARGEITGTQAAQLKAKYLDLYDTLNKSRQHEFELLQQAKSYTTSIEEQEEELSKADNFPDNINTEVQRLREQLLKFNNELMQSQERNYEFDYKIECLEEEKRIMEREYQRMPKSEEHEKRIQLLELANTNLSNESDQLKRDSKKLKESMYEFLEQESRLREQYNVIKEHLEKDKSQLVQINSLPSQFSKEAEKHRKLFNECTRESKELNERYEDLRQQIVKLEKRKMLLKKEDEEINSSKTKLELDMSELQEEFDRIQRETEYLKEKEMILATDKATLELNLRHLSLEKRTLHETHTRKFREKDRELRNLKKSQLQFKVAEEALVLTRQIHEKTQANFDGFPKDDGALFEQRKNLQHDVDAKKRVLDQQNSHSAVETVKVTQSIEDEERMLYDLQDLRIEVVELTRLATIKADEREQKARDFMKAEMRYHRTVEDLKKKQLDIQDNKKKHYETSVKLRDFAKLYDIIKNERNKCVTLIQTTTQKAAEMREKLRILLNEIEILRTSLQHKDKQLQKQRLRHSNSIVMRDALQNEVAKQVRNERKFKEKRDQQRLDIKRLNSMVSLSEAAMLQLRKSSDKAIQNRNDRAVQLIERNEEVYILQEKVRIQESMMTNGEMELQHREEDIKFLQRHLQELSRSLSLLRNCLPKKCMLENEQTTLQIQLSFAQDRMLELEERAENPETDGRLRFLEGHDPTPVELLTRNEELEIRLAAKEEQLLEKELLLDAVSNLVETVKSKAMGGRDDTLQLAKDVNKYKSRMNITTKKIKATTAELTMYMSQAMRIQQEVKEREAELEQCYRRMEKGEPPNELIAAEWLRMRAIEERRANELDMFNQNAVERAQYEIVGGVSTTAEPRPNAYIPDNENELPIPRPYGGHAPFRPTETGSNMRHIRKPKPKPIEI